MKYLSLLLLLLSTPAFAGYSPATIITDPAGVNQAVVKNTTPLAGDEAVACILHPNSAAVGVTGTFWQATQPVSSTQYPAALDGSGFFKVHEQGTAATSVADGSNVTIGAKADAAATDSTSSWSLISIGKGLWAKLGTINTTLGSPFQAGGALGSGSAIIGKVGIDQTTPGTTNRVAANLDQVAGASISQGHGTAATAIRVELPTDGTGVVGLNAGSAIVGKVGIDQTTPGTTNGVQINAAVPAGSNIIGKVSIDQTTPGTTNLVNIGTNGTVQEKAPLNSTGSGAAAAATVSTVITLTAPANAVGAFLMNIDTSSANIRWAVNRTASATLGQQLQPGRDQWIPTSHDISLCAESGTQTYDVQWISQ